MVIQATKEGGKRLKVATAYKHEGREAGSVIVPDADTISAR
jgi:hypothetical protein